MTRNDKEEAKMTREWQQATSGSQARAYIEYPGRQLGLHGREEGPRPAKRMAGRSRDDNTPVSISS